MVQPQQGGDRLNSNVQAHVNLVDMGAQLLHSLANYVKHELARRNYGYEPGKQR